MKQYRLAGGSSGFEQIDEVRSSVSQMAEEAQSIRHSPIKNQSYSRSLKSPESWRDLSMKINNWQRQDKEHMSQNSLSRQSEKSKSRNQNEQAITILKFSKTVQDKLLLLRQERRLVTRQIMRLNSSIRGRMNPKRLKV